MGLASARDLLGEQSFIDEARQDGAVEEQKRKIVEINSCPMAILNNLAEFFVRISQLVVGFISRPFKACLKAIVTSSVCVSGQERFATAFRASAVAFLVFSCVNCVM